MQLNNVFYVNLCLKLSETLGMLIVSNSGSRPFCGFGTNCITSCFHDTKHKCISQNARKGYSK